MSDTRDPHTADDATNLSEAGALEPLLTAYALGEIDSVQRARIDLFLQGASPAAQGFRAEIAEIRALGTVLQDELGREMASMQVPGLTPRQHSAISAAAQDRAPGPLRPHVRLRRFISALSAALAASILLVVLVTQASPPDGGHERILRDHRAGGSVGPLAYQAVPVDRDEALTPAAPSIDIAERSAAPGSVAGDFRQRASQDRRLLGAVPAAAPAAAPMQADAAAAVNDAPAAAASRPAPSYAHAVRVPGAIQGSANSSSPVSTVPEPSPVAAAARPEPPRPQRTVGFAQAGSLPVQPASFPFIEDHGGVATFVHYLSAGQWPTADEIGVQEVLQSLGAVPGPNLGDSPIACGARIGICPWRPDHLLVLVSMRGHGDVTQPRQPGTLLALVNCSASMKQGGRLGLIKAALDDIGAHLGQGDEFGVQSFAHGARQELPLSTHADSARIHDGIAMLQLGGELDSQSACDGLQRAVATMIQRNRRAVARIVLCTDCMASLDDASFQRMAMVMELLREQGINLSVLCLDDAGADASRLALLVRMAHGRLDFARTATQVQQALDDQLGSAPVVAVDVNARIGVNATVVAQATLIGTGVLTATANVPVRPHGIALLDGQSFSNLYELEMTPAATAAGLLAERPPVQVLHLAISYCAVTDGHERVVEYPVMTHGASPPGDESFAYGVLSAELDAFLRPDGTVPGSQDRVLQQARAITGMSKGPGFNALLLALIGRRQHAAPQGAH